MKRFALLLALILASTLAFLGGYHEGKLHSKNPTIVVNRREEDVVVVPGTRICPEKDLCQWIVWDVTTNAEVHPK